MRVPILTLALLYGPTIDDIAFDEVVENFVIDTVPRPFILKNRLPSQIHKYAIGLSNKHYHVRDVSQRKLIEYFSKQPGDIHYMYWLLRNNDKEVANRAGQILADFYKCPWCYIEYWYRYGKCKRCKVGRYKYADD